MLGLSSTHPTVLGFFKCAFSCLVLCRKDSTRRDSDCHILQLTCQGTASVQAVAFFQTFLKKRDVKCCKQRDCTMLTHGAEVTVVCILNAGIFKGKDTVFLGCIFTLCIFMVGRGKINNCYVSVKKKRKKGAL